MRPGLSLGATRVTRLATHWVERCGIDEVGSWFFEVWNEPNLPAFWTGTRAEYFDLYRCTAVALEDVNARLQVGGSAVLSDRRALLVEQRVPAEPVGRARHEERPRRRTPRPTAQWPVGRCASPDR
jgi:hypothetical protein